MSQISRPRIGITVGDINGVGLEVILKTLANKKILQYCTPVIYGSPKAIAYHKNIVGVDLQFTNIRGAEATETDKINVVTCWQDNVNITIGKLTEVSGKYAFKALEQAVSDLKMGLIDALVTAPINKKAMQMADFPFPGHTEYLTNAFEVKDSLMLMVSDELRVGLVTNHLPLSDVANAVTQAKITYKLNMLNQTLRVDFGIERPTIAVLGLNPHAGDEGAIGGEETKIILPAIMQAKEKGIMAIGPFAADGFFGNGTFQKFDAVLAMYHDQGLVPFKALSFGNGVNFTAGLPFVRTSPDHGTGYDIAGQNLADETSFRKALFLALDITLKRKEYAETHANPLRVKGVVLKQEDGDFAE